MLTDLPSEQAANDVNGPAPLSGHSLKQARCWMLKKGMKGEGEGSREINNRGKNFIKYNYIYNGLY